MSRKSVLKWLLVGFMIGFVGVVGCNERLFQYKPEETPKYQKQEPTPTAPCRLVPLIAGTCVDPKEAKNAQ